MSKINKLILAVVTTLCLPSFALAQVSNAAPQTFWRETDQTLPKGLYRIRVNNDKFVMDMNTDATGAFGTVSTFFAVTGGAVSLVDMGSGTLSHAFTSGKYVISIANTNSVAEMDFKADTAKFIVQAFGSGSVGTYDGISTANAVIMEAQSATNIFLGSSGNTTINFAPGHIIAWTITGGATNNFVPGFNNTVDIGTSAKAVRSIYTSTSIVDSGVINQGIVTNATGNHYIGDNVPLGVYLDVASNTDSNFPTLNFYRSQGTQAARVDISTSSVFGEIVAYGRVSSMLPAAKIRFVENGGYGGAPAGNIQFFLTPGNSNPVLRWGMDSNGELYAGGQTSSNVAIRPDFSTPTQLNVILGDNSDYASLLAKGLVGTVTNDNAPAGDVGEVISQTVAQGAAVTDASGSAASIASIVLPPGDWEAQGVVDYVVATTTSVTSLIQGTTSAPGCQYAPAIPPQDQYTAFEIPATVLNPVVDPAWEVPYHRYSLATTTTLCLITKPTFSLSTLKSYGTITARRRR